MTVYGCSDQVRTGYNVTAYAKSLTYFFTHMRHVPFSHQLGYHNYVLIQMHISLLWRYYIGNTSTRT